VPERKKPSSVIAAVGEETPLGCPFFGRCLISDGFCCKNIPPLEEKTPGHYAACFKT
jgi:ABC-type dipeptide/oligopeptide/nickel transport system ATPase component